MADEEQNVKVQQITEEKLDSTTIIKDEKTETGTTNTKRSTKQENVIRKLNQVLDFLHNVRIANDESLEKIHKPLDDLLSSMKYLPVEHGKCFDDLPVELKTDILSYTCDDGAFVAATVCQEWKIILEPRLADLAYVSLGKCCSNPVPCSYTDDEYIFSQDYAQDSSCYMPEQMLKASITLGMDIPMEICCPVTHVDTKILVEGLNISNFKIFTRCICREDAWGKIDDEPLMTQDQTEHLLEAMEEETEINSVEIKGLDMTYLDQERLIDCLLRVKKLTLAEGNYLDWTDQFVFPDPILDFRRFVRKLLEASTELKLSSLKLEYFQCAEYLGVELANALCKLKTVKIGEHCPLHESTLLQLIENIQNGVCKIKFIFIHRHVNWCVLTTLDGLKMLLTYMREVTLWGRFTREQLEAAKSLPGVEVIETVERDSDQEDIISYVKILKDYR